MNKEVFLISGLSLILTFSLISCRATRSSVQYDKVYPFNSFCLLKDGYWGEWEKVTTDYQYGTNRYFFQVQIKYSTQSLEILLYRRSDHPSDFQVKIIIDKRTGKVQNTDWFSYQGTITAKEIPITRMSEYSSSYIRVSDYKTIKCEIWCDNDMKRAIDKNGLIGTINLFYGGEFGNGFSFRY